jgi:ubiquitin C-terminal hydrolase
MASNDENVYEKMIFEEKHVPFLNGIVNGTNTCYMNALIQCLQNLKPLINVFLNTELLNFYKKQNMHFLDIIGNVFKLNFDTSVRPSEREKVMNKLKLFLCTGINFEWQQQQDPHEFLIQLVLRLKEDIRMMSSNNIYDNVKHFFDDGLALNIQGRIICSKCNRMGRIDDDKCCILSLNINECRSVNDCLKHYFKDTIFSGYNAYMCQYCNMKREATQSKQITNLPEILIIHLNLFQNVGSRVTIFI